ncbi:Ras-related protein Rab-26-like [Homarus americanus]|uniref:Ras-related protein Rab-26-like n=1 Tax=Homarus americanus TaxID=6706 RepID=A0A8J5JIW6_HOMAM|nr:Ras-related protein Rab-26-like [Homarus americanus]
MVPYISGGGMSVETNLPHSGGGNGHTDDRRYSYSDYELRRNNTRVVRPQMTSQNGVITINSDSDIPRRVDLRRAKSLREEKKEYQPKRNSVIFDLPEKNGRDATSDVSYFNYRHGPKKPPRLKIHEEVEDEGETKQDKQEEGFNSVTFRRSLVSGLARVRSLGGKDPESQKAVAERRTPRNNGAYVQFRNEEGDWRRHSIRRVSQFETCDHTFKVMLIGDSCVGKTCILTRFKDGTFLSGSFISTVGIDFRGYCTVSMIWDTAGQERFRSVTHAYYRDAHALLLLYDVMNKNSYKHAGVVGRGNKCEVSGERVVRREDGERLAREYNVAFMETSAKTGLNVDSAFMAVARELKARKSNNPNERKFNVADYVRQEAKTEACLCNVG